MTTQPDGLSARGAALWADLDATRDLAGGGARLAEEACRIADRLDHLHDIIAGRGVLHLMHLRSMFDLDDDDTRHFSMTVDAVMGEARQQANVLRQIVAGLPVRGDDDGDPDAANFVDGLGG